MRKLGVWANADYPARRRARRCAFGAEGIGLCRTEHMFFEEERLPVVRQMILTAAEATRLDGALYDAQAALAKLGDDSEKRAEAEEAASESRRRPREARRP